MKMTQTLSAMALMAALAVPVAQAQSYRQHEAAKRAQDRSDKRHHTTAKVIGGSAVGGAVIGGALGGGKGALIGGALGAGGGAIGDHARKANGVKQRERHGNY
jgi:hypothetical protein